MAVKIVGYNSGNVAEVDSNNNLKINLPIVLSQAGIGSNASQVDAGTITGTRYVRVIDSSSEARMKVGLDTTMLSEVFSGTVINTAVFNTPIATATALQAGGFLTLNTSGSITAAQGSSLRTYRTFPIYNKFTTVFEFILNMSYAVGFYNVMCEWGAGLAGTSPATGATDGAIFRYTPSGLSCLIINNGIELCETFITGAQLTATGVNVAQTTKYAIIFEEDVVSFWISPSGRYQMTLCLEIPRPASGNMPNQSMELPVYARLINVGTNSGLIQKLNIAFVGVYLGDMNNNKPYAHTMAGAQNFCQSAFSGQTAGKTANFNNWTTLPAQTTALTVSAIGTGASAGLGGYQRVGNSIAMSADSAYIIYSYPVPALTVTVPIIPAKSLYITGFRLDMSSRGATGAANATVFTIGLNIGHFQADPSTGDNATTPAKQGRIDTIGQIACVTSVPIGTYLGSTGHVAMQSPLVIQSGERISVWCSPSVAYTMTSSQEFVFTCHFDGYWE